MSNAAHIRYQSKLFTGSSHSWALEKLADLPSSAAVLDIGPGSGVIGRALRDQGITDLSAVEIDPDAREHVRPIYRQVTESLDQLGSQRFDVVLLLDVIEHMAEPEKFLRLVSERLNDGGKILISVPNIAHWSVRFQLLFGFFQYTNRGLLDRTHLQFFTRSRVKAFDTAVPVLAARELDSTIPPLELIFPESVSTSALFQWFSRFRLGCARFWPGMFAYQHLSLLEKHPASQKAEQAAA